MTGPQDLAQTRGQKRADAGMTTSSVRRLVKYVWLQNEGDTGDPTRGRDCPSDTGVRLDWGLQRQLGLSMGHVHPQH